FAQDKTSFTFSGGTSSNLEAAKRIAVAEAFERSLLSEIAKDSNSRKDFLIEENPSSSGFAAGFKQENTEFRALCEGLECWAWSKWIDDGYKVLRVNKPEKLTKLTKYLLSPFKENLWFSKSFQIMFKNNILNLNFVVFLGCSENGIFSGSRVSTSMDELWEHPVIEAYRNYKNFLLYSQAKFPLTDIIQKRVIYFAKNKQCAIDQINRASREDWPQPEILLLKDYRTNHPEVFLTRCLMKNFLSWNLGDVSRFVY